jgi:hypothetical protein
VGKAGLFSDGQVLALHLKVGSNNTEKVAGIKFGKFLGASVAPGAKRRASEGGGLRPAERGATTKF